MVLVRTNSECNLKIPDMFSFRLTNSMEQVLSWKANSSQPFKLCAFCGTWRFISLFTRGNKLSVLSQINLVHAILPYYLKICFNIIFLPHSPLFDHLDNILWGVQIMKLIIMQLSPVPSYFPPLRPKYILQHPVLEHFQPMFFS